MQEFRGKSVIDKIAMGEVKVFKNKKTEVKKTLIEDVSLEIVRFEEGLKASTDQLSKLYKKALESVSENEAEIFEVHKMMLEDDGFLNAIKDRIKEEKYVPSMPLNVRRMNMLSFLQIWTTNTCRHGQPMLKTYPTD